MTILYYSPGSASMLVHWLLIELDLPHELRRLDFEQRQQKSAGYLALNPGGVVPTLVLDGRPMVESAAIALHLAEQFVWPNRPLVHEGAPILVDSTRQWVAFEVPPLMDSDHFLPIGAAALRLGLVTAGALGQGRGMLMDMRAVVDHAAAIWTPKRRSARV